MTAVPVNASFPCAVCGEVAARVSLLPPGEVGPGSEVSAFAGMWRLVIEGGPVPMTVGPVREWRAVAAALAARDLERLAAVHAEYANFRCPLCRAGYCREHWSDVIPERDEGFYDATFGTCPNGHRVMLDD